MQSKTPEARFPQQIIAGAVNGRTLPGQVYHDPRLLELERETLFHGAWICVGRADQFAEPGCYEAFDIGGEPVLVVADAAGAVRAFANVCRHRGALLVQGAGRSQRLVCPYHAWTYAMDGRLVAAPFMDRTVGFSVDECRLPEYAVEIWQGFVFVSLDREATPLAPRLASLEALMRPYRFETYHVATAGRDVWRANWKLMVENASESYHLFKAHQTSIEPLRPTKDQEFRASGEAFHAHLMNAAADAPTPATPHAPDLGEDQRRQLIIACIFPATVLVMSGTDLGWFTVSPRSVDESVVYFGGALPWKLPDGAQGDRIREQIAEFGERINGEDRGVLEAVHAGSASRSFRNSRMSYLEVPVFEFHQYLRRNLPAAALGES